MSFWKTIFFSALAIVAIEKSDACTGIVHEAVNGDVVYARTLEFGEDLVSFSLLFMPREMSQTAQSNPNGPQAAIWNNRYAFIGFNPFGLPVLADGLNEKGLACGAFYFPGWAEYQQASNNESAPISNLDVVGWILGNFATVDEVVSALKNTTVIGFNYQPWGIIPPLHYIIVDKNGNKVVIEYIKGILNLHEATLGTITNSPNYDWHVTNARNYIGLGSLNKPSIEISGKELSAFGQGSGAIGLPGDFTPPSRFIRATFLNQVVLSEKDGLAEVERSFKILNQFDIPKGAVKEMTNGKPSYEETQWTSASDLAHLRYYYHTAKSGVIRFVDLKNLDLNGKEMKSMSIDTAEPFVDVSSNLKS
jgi:choloylglycine hydrolase